MHCLCPGTAGSTFWAEDGQNWEQRRNAQVRGCILGTGSSWSWAVQHRLPGRSGHSVGCCDCTWLGFTTRGQGRGRSDPAQVSLDLGNPQLPEPGTGPAPATAAPGRKAGLGMPSTTSARSPLHPAASCAHQAPTALPLPAEAGIPAAGPGKLFAVPGNLLTSENQIWKEPLTRGQRQGRAEREQQSCCCAPTRY